MSFLYIIADPNGAGKTAFIKRFAPLELARLAFIGANEIARGSKTRRPYGKTGLTRWTGLRVTTLTAHPKYRLLSASRPQCEPTKSYNPENPVNPVLKLDHP